MWKHQNNAWRKFKDNKKTPERRSGVFIVNFEQISHIALMGKKYLQDQSVA